MLATPYEDDDLKKAFDTVNHNILISKLSMFNVSKRSLSWFDSYLKGREQCVVINNINKSASSSRKTCDAVADELTKNLEKVSAWLDASCLTLNTVFPLKKLPATESLNVRIKDELNK